MWTDLNKIAKYQLAKRNAPCLFEPNDIVQSCFSSGLYEKWVYMYDGSKSCTLKVAELLQIFNDLPENDELNSQKCNDENDPAYWRSLKGGARPKEEGLLKLAPLFSWLKFKFTNYVGDELRCKRSRTTLNPPTSKNKPGSEPTVWAMQLTEVIDPAANSSREFDLEFLHKIDKLEAQVLEMFYLQEMTREQIAVKLQCHPNTVSAIKKSALASCTKLLVPSPTTNLP